LRTARERSVGCPETRRSSAAESAIGIVLQGAGGPRHIRDQHGLGRVGVEGAIGALALASAFDAAAAERAADGEGIRAKALATAAQPPLALRANAPFRAGHDAVNDLFRPAEAPREKSRGACELHARALCYDASERRVVYRAGREYMPGIEGMRAESISLRRGRLTFKYSFR
jgi:hypothetical protein